MLEYFSFEIGNTDTELLFSLYTCSSASFYAACVLLKLGINMPQMISCVSSKFIHS